MKYPTHVIRLLRPHQWVKNGFVLFPVFFANRITDPEIWPALAAAFFSFCLVSSAIYIFNDIRDIEFDRKHPTKRSRPLAKGVVSQTMAFCIMGLAAISGFCLAALCAGFDTMLVIFGYAVLNILYSLRIKRIAILDIISIATGFVLRLEAGSFATSIELSHWIVLMTFLLAMFLALAKRRSELILALRGNVTRDSLKGYSLEFLSAAMVLMAGITVVCYIMWTVSPEVIERYRTDNIYYSSFWVILGLLRYMQIVYIEDKSGSPTRVLYRDRFIQFAVVGWLTTLTIQLYT